MLKRRVKNRNKARPYRQSIENSRMEFSVDHLENRILLAALFIEYGDNFAGGTLNTTQGAFRDVANSATPDERILGTELVDSANNFNAGTQLDIVAQTFTATERAQILAIVERAFAPLDIEVIELTTSAQMTSDGRSVASASSMADVITTLRGGDASSRDAYIFVGTFVVDPGGPNQQIYGPGGGGLSPGSPVLGETSDLASASNVHDDVAVVYNAGGFSNNTVNNISHEAGHLFGLQHAITNATNNATTNLFHQAEIMSYRNTNNTTSSMFTRYPMIRGDGNSPNTGILGSYDDLAARNGFQTTHDQLINDGTIGANPNFTFVSGTGAHDIITIVRNGANADVTVQAFADAAYTTAIEVPGLVAGPTFSYTIPLTTTLLVYGGDSNDRFVVDGDLGVDVLIDGMLGTDSLMLDGKGSAMATFTPDATSLNGTDLVPDFGATIGIGGTTVTLRNFDTAGLVSIEDVQMVSYQSTGGNDDLSIELTSMITSSVTGTVNGGTTVIPLMLDDDLATLGLAGGLGIDQFDVSGSGGFLAMQESLLVGAFQDNGTLIFDLDGSAGPGGLGPLNGDELAIVFQGFQSFDTSTVATNFDIFLTSGNDNARLEAGGFLAGFQATRVVDVNGTFSTFRYTNKGNVTLDALEGDDVVTNTDTVIANGELTKTLVGNLGNDTFQLGGADSTSIGGMGNDAYEIVDDVSVVTLTIVELLGEGSDTVDFSSLATPAMSTPQTGTGLAMAGNAMVEVGAAGQQKNIEFGINAAPYVAYTVAPPTGVPFMTMDYEVEYADVGTMSTHTAVFDWGDGNSDPGIVMPNLGMGTATGSHQFDAVDTFNVLATILDDEGLSKTDAAMTTIQQFALLPDQKNPALTALYVGGTVGIDILKFKSLNNGDIRAVLNGDTLGEFSFDGSIFAYGGSGNDLITPTNEINKTLCFEGGGDVDILRGSVGNDFLMGQGGKDTIVGRGGDDTIEGGTERDYLYGQDGNDTILAGIGNDVVKGGDGNDFIDGGSGNDVIRGEAGDDLLLGRGNDDKLIGGAGDDVIGGGSGADKLVGGGGNDLLIGEATTHDSDPTAWMSIRDEWVFSAAAIPTRMANIMAGGGLNGANILASGVTVFDDTQVDKLNSGSGTDWYLVFPNDTTQGVSGVDVVTIL